MAGISYEYRSAASEVSHSYLYGPVSELLEDVPANALVVDLGCGNGSFLALFQKRGWQLYRGDMDAGCESVAANPGSCNDRNGMGDSGARACPKANG